MRSKEEKRILTSKISGIEDEYYKLKNENIPCAVVWYEDIKILIPSTHLGVTKINKSTIRGMLGSEIDFIIMEKNQILMKFHGIKFFLFLVFIIYAIYLSF